jgi:hypothetical protein
VHAYLHACICTLDTGSFVVETDGDRRMHAYLHACICTLDTGSLVVIETDGDKLCICGLFHFIFHSRPSVKCFITYNSMEQCHF